MLSFIIMIIRVLIVVLLSSILMIPSVVSIETKTLKLSLNVPDYHLIFIPLFFQHFDFHLQLLKQQNSIYILISFQDFVFFFESLKHTIIFFHFSCKLVIHFENNVVFLVEFLTHSEYLLLKLIQGALRLALGLAAFLSPHSQT